MNTVRLIESWVRVLLALVWTALVGVPFVLIAYPRYLVGLLGVWFGRPAMLNRAIARNLDTFELVTRDFWSRGIFVLTRMSFRAHAETPVNWTRTHVICANHTSVFDIFALMSAVPVPVRFVANRELAKWPLVGWSLRPAGQILVDRGNREKAIRSISEADVETIRGQVIFFVEGTRSRDGELLPFKKGAFHFALVNQLPLLPTAIGGAHTALDRRAWWNLNPGSEIEVEFCDPIEVPRAWAEGDRGLLVDKLREQTRKTISEALGRSEAKRSAA